MDVHSISVYEDIWALTRNMLIAVRKEDWDRLVELEGKRSALVGNLKDDEDEVLSPQEQARKSDLIKAILAADEEIRPLAESWMGELRTLMDSIGTEKKLQKAYEAP